MKTDRKSVKLAFIATIISLISFTWFSFRPGLFGTFNWHVGILCAYIFLCVTVLFPSIFLLLNSAKQNKATRILSKIFSIFSMTLWILIFIGLTVLAEIPVDKKGIILLDQKQELPANTSAKKGEPVAKYAFASDPHWGSGSSDANARTKILQQIDSRAYNAFFCLGDISSVGMITSIYQDAINDITDNIHKTPSYFMAGNHDGIVNGIRAYKKIFMNKDDKLYFRMDNGKIHMLFLYMLWDDTDFSKKQEKWLINQLESIPQDDTVIVLSHCYVTGSGYYDSAAKKNWGDIPSVIDRLCPILEKYNVDLYLSGHNHFFELLEKSDVDYVILGSMGGKLDENLIYSSPYSKWVNNTDFGWVDMEVYEENLKLTIYKYDGTVLKEKIVATK